MKTLITGIKPTGQIHLGNYLGAFKPAFEYQNDYESYIFLANLHALTTFQKGSELKIHSENLAIDLLSLGLDPEKSTFFIQSQIPEHSELMWILGSLAPMGLLERAHAWKDFKNKGLRDPNLSLFSYPVLMAADILLYQADIVPVGSDQKQHIEITRDLASKFNNNFGETFKMPEELITFPVDVPGIDGRKMSKSYNNYIPIFAPESEIKKTIMKISTDSTPVEDTKNPETCNVFNIYKLVASETDIQNLKDKYLAGGFGYGDAKKELLRVYLEYFAEAREKRTKFENNIDLVQSILQNGKQKAQAKAKQTLELVKKNTGINLF